MRTRYHCNDCNIDFEVIRSDAGSRAACPQCFRRKNTYQLRNTGGRKVPLTKHPVGRI